ncbi:MAG: response regulator, partial [Deltaproteobacteria bacterium]|nr:response regulator [Deltaproteobacteria bacterium]
AAYDLIITDQTMPRMTGTTLIRKIKQLSPLTPVILSTGYSSMLDSQTADAIGARSVILKPYDRQFIAHEVRRALDTPSETAPTVDPDRT